MSEFIEAVVQVGEQETPYLRCGHGAPAVVLLALDPAKRLELLDLLSTRRRVVAPRLEQCGGVLGDGAAIARWLRGLLDGLGLERPTLLLCPALASHAASLAAHFPDALDVATVAGAAEWRVPEPPAG